MSDKTIMQAMQHSPGLGSFLLEVKKVLKELDPDARLTFNEEVICTVLDRRLTNMAHMTQTAYRNSFSSAPIG